MKSHSTMFIIEQIAIEQFMLAIIIWSVTNTIKFKVLDQLLVIFNCDNKFPGTILTLLKTKSLSKNIHIISNCQF